MRSLVALEPGEARRLVCPWCGRAAERGMSGFKAVRDGQVIGAIVVAASERERDLCPPDAVVIASLWVRREDVGEHVGTQLVQRVCGQLLLRKSRCLVAYGTRGRPDCSHLPATWLEEVGFVEHVEGVQWRIELSRTLPALSVVRDAAAAVGRLVRPESPHPAPANRS